jgi:hypothetical protein
MISFLNQSEKMDNTKIKSICMACIYAEDFDISFKFYNSLLGLNASTPITIPPGDEKIARSTFTFEVDSAFNMYKKLKEENVKLIQTEPEKMTDEPKPIYWFQCFDQSNNIVEFLGGE